MPIIQLDVPDQSLQRLDALRAKTESDYGAVISNALRLYEAMIERDETGQKLFEQVDGSYVEWMPFQTTTDRTSHSRKRSTFRGGSRICYFWLKTSTLTMWKLSLVAGLKLLFPCEHFVLRGKADRHDVAATKHPEREHGITIL